ncbi:MAG TPA: hypothetical protein VLJ59_03690 [Mycobacteriales bacterium]|nr:hypothetical protein [Mycobacteriales bacterium]
MTGARLVGSGVLLLDLRDGAAGPAEHQVHEALRNHRFRESGRALVVDDVANLTENHSVYEALRVSKLIHGVVRVAIGPPVGRPTGSVLRTTPVLDGEGAATLWVGDPDGVGWEIDLARVLAPEAVPTMAGPALQMLLDVLCIPDVFDRVVTLAGHLPGRVACPGAIVVAGLVGPDELAEAQARAIRAVAGTSDEPGLDPDELDPLLDLEAGDPYSRVLPSSVADLRYRAAVGQCQEALDQVMAILGPLGPAVHGQPGRLVWQQVVAAGRALADFRALLTEQFVQVDGRNGLDDAQRQRLRNEVGIVAERPPDTDGPALTSRIRDRVVAAIGGGRSLWAVRYGLRDVAERAAPAGSGARVHELAEICPDSTIDRLAAPPPFSWRTFEPWVVGAVLGCCFLAGLAGWPAGPLLGLGWTAGVGLAMLRRPVAADHGSHVGSGPVATLLHLLLGLTGAAAGGWAGAMVPVPLLGRVALLVAAVSALVFVLRYWWSRAVDDWLAALALLPAAAAAIALNDALTEVAWAEWALSDVRRRSSDATRDVAQVLAEAAAALTDRADLEFGVDVGSRTGSSLRTELDRVVTADIEDATLLALAPCWDSLRIGRANLGDGLVGRLDDLLADYRRHLELRGAAERPPFARRSAHRAALTETVWQSSPELERILRNPSPAGLMVQLCDADDIGLLRPAAGLTMLLRFAPQAAQVVFTDETSHGPGAAGDLAEVLWTESGNLGGALRLVPLRTDAVESAWPASANEDYLR